MAASLIGSGCLRKPVCGRVRQTALRHLCKRTQICRYGHNGHHGQETSMHQTPREDSHWTVALAKARLSEVIERAQSAPQTITKNGRPSVVVVSADEWQRKTDRKGTLSEFLLASPLRGAALDLERPRDEPRDSDQ
jgi:prevent-host-death family protein